MTRHLRLIQRACNLMDRSPQPMASGDLANQLGISVSHCDRLFKSHLGITPKEYAHQKRLMAFKEKLDQGHPVLDACFESGFESVSQAYEQGKRLGMTPAQRRLRAREVPMNFGVVQTVLGAVLVAQTPKGVCDVRWGKSASELITDFQNQFSHACLVGSSETFDLTLAQISGLINEGLPVALPLDIQGTVFQQKVWASLQHIPLGTTWTYAQVAEHIGMPKAVRAVANACASNRIALLVPCHRVVRTDGAIGGYRWGVDNKKRLLDQEKLFQ